MVKINNLNTSVNQDFVKNNPVKSSNVADKTIENIKEDKEIKKEEKIDGEKLKSAVKAANTLFFKNNTHLKFEIHEKTQEVMVRIVRDDTGEVVKEIPPEKMLDMVAKIWETLGILVDEKR